MKPAERLDLNVDDEHSSRFLKLLDPSARGFTFQTADDDRGRKNPLLARIIQSPPPVREQLRKLNEQEAGIYYPDQRTRA